MGSIRELPVAQLGGGVLCLVLVVSSTVPSHAGDKDELGTGPTWTAWTAGSMKEKVWVQTVNLVRPPVT